MYKLLLVETNYIYNKKTFKFAGNIMTVSYNVGLTAGSLVAYLLDAMLGPQVPTPCGAFYPTIGPISKLTTRAPNITVAELSTMATVFIVNTLTNSTIPNNLTTSFPLTTYIPPINSNVPTNTSFYNTSLSLNESTHTATISWQLKD